MSTIERRLLIVEDEPLTSALLTHTVSSAGFAVRVASSAAEARELARSFDPDIALLDISLGRGPSGIDLAHVLHREHRHVALLFLTKHPDLRTAGVDRSDLPPGAGFLSKSVVGDAETLLSTIELVVRDHEAILTERAPTDAGLSELSPTKIEVLRMVAQGYTNTEIARRRGTTVSAVEQMLNAIFTSLKIKGDPAISPRAEAMRRYIDAVGLPTRD